MDEKKASQWLDELARGERKDFLVKKEDFLIFRKVLTSRPDFKHFRGIALRGGDVRYEYLKEPRS